MTDTIPEAVIEAVQVKIAELICTDCTSRYVAVSALKAAEQAGYKLVPVEPTEAMIRGADDSGAFENGEFVVGDWAIASAIKGAIAASPKVGP